MTGLDRTSERRYAATLQCIAEGLRIEACGRDLRTNDLQRCAAALDHMAASLLVPLEPKRRISDGAWGDAPIPSITADDEAFARRAARVDVA